MTAKVSPKSIKIEARTGQAQALHTAIVTLGSAIPLMLDKLEQIPTATRHLFGSL